MSVGPAQRLTHVVSVLMCVQEHITCQSKFTLSLASSSYAFEVFLVLTTLFSAPYIHPTLVTGHTCPSHSASPVTIDVELAVFAGTEKHYVVTVGDQIPPDIKECLLLLEIDSMILLLELIDDVLHRESFHIFKLSWCLLCSWMYDRCGTCQSSPSQRSFIVPRADIWPKSNTRAF